MQSVDSVLAIVPARGGSKGLPRKNLRKLGGRPLVSWPISAALGAKCVSRVIISTDDLEIAEAARLVGAEVPFLRPAALASDDASSMDVVLHAINFFESKGVFFDFVLMLEPTSPLTDSEDVDAAFAMLRSSGKNADSIVGISRVEAAHPEYDVRLVEKGFIVPYAAPDFKSLRRRQEIEELYFLEGSLYLSRVEAFRKHRSFYHERTLGYPVPRWKSLEVDEHIDFVLIEAVLERIEQIKLESK
jgi:N-acylneuraminate cytidylyltransferase/CMP-N,N'-diacetyllegionaminic acid synthase